MRAKVNRHEPTFEPHRPPIESLYALLACSPDGLSQLEARERLEHEGPNLLAEVRGPSLALRLARHLGHPFALLLWAGAGLAALAERFNPGEGMLLIAAALVAVVLLNGAFSFWQETRVEHAMAAFRSMLSPRARVVRDREEIDVDAAELVAGDVIILRAGDRVPADARLLEASSLKVDNSPLTGECEPQLRTLARATGPRLESRNLVFTGTLVTTGVGKALVYATGELTEIGHIARVALETVRIETPIRREIRHFIRVITWIALALGGVFFAIGTALGNPFWTNLIFAIGIIVANVPEGLLPTVTLGLAIAGRKMAKQNALLKTLESAETLGCTTVICTDKTGTITQNEMRVTDLLLADRDDASDSSVEEHELALCIMALCNNARLEEKHGHTRAVGDPTETALLVHVEMLQPGSVERRRSDWPRLYERPFDSDTREMATVHQAPEGPWSLLKGAPEVVIKQCARYRREGQSLALTQEVADEIGARANGLARRGRRVLALARKSLDASADWDEAVLAPGYEFIGLVAMHDPPRPEVSDAVARCRAAGIRVVVVSGDHPLTVQAIAYEVGIVRSASAPVRTGADLAGWSEAALRRALSSEEVVFARTSPLDKLRIVSALQQIGHVVAVTGDGVNDAPAIKRADIGIAMGQTGTDVAREAADMVLMDDNFATIVAAVEEGRVVYANIRRFVGYVLTSNVPEMLPYIAFVLLAIPLPLTVLLILAVDLGTDMAPAIALATEGAESDVMQAPPRPRSERLLSRGLLVSSYLVFGLVESAAGFAAYLWVLLGEGWRPGVQLASSDPLYGRAIGAFFCAVVICQVANVLVWRTSRESVIKKGILRNHAVVLGVAVELLLLVLVVETEIGHRVFSTAALPAAAWLVPIPFALGMFGLAECFKAIARWKARQHVARLLLRTTTGRHDHGNRTT